MNVLLLLAGIADPKWPLPAEPLDAAALQAQRARYPLLSPFDEAALELALKLRDADASTHISALLAASGADDALLRHVASFRLDRVDGYDSAACPAWNSAALAEAIAAHVRGRAEAPDLLLIGREFGDLDDGSLPARLAEALGLPGVSLALQVQRGEGGLLITRQQGAQQEELQQSLPALVAVSNHARNRLRHPLLKNVMAAKKLSFDCLTLPAAEADAAPLRLAGLHAAVAAQRQGRCQMLEGDMESQARALAAALRGHAAPATQGGAQ